MNINNFIKKVKIFADGADKTSLLELAKKDWVAGFTTNPTLMKKAGITDYKAFALDVLSEIKDRPISFEVFSDDLNEMKTQALEIASWADNVYVKIPVTNTLGEPTTDLVQHLSHSNVKVNVTAVFTLDQVTAAAKALKSGVPSVISIFAGRISDTGKNSVPIMKKSLTICKSIDENIEVLWASPRQLYDLVLADDIGCDIITISHDILGKINLLGKDLNEFSLETVKMFYNDGLKAGFKL